MGKLRAEAMERFAGYDGYVGIAKSLRGSYVAGARARANFSQRATTALSRRRNFHLFFQRLEEVRLHAPIWHSAVRWRRVHLNDIRYQGFLVCDLDTSDWSTTGW